MNSLENRLRIPLIRFGSDDAPTAKWEWWFYPIVIPVIFCALFIAFALWVILGPPLWLISSAREKSRMDKLRTKMMDAGRYLPASMLCEKIESTCGTLIVECGATTLFWWTSDDILSNAPVALPNTFDESQSEQVATFAQRCLQTYSDRSTGSAMLTEEPDLNGLEETLNVVTIRTWGNEPEIVGRLFLRTY